MLTKRTGEWGFGANEAHWAGGGGAGECGKGWRCTHKAVHTQGGARTRQCIHNAGHTQGGLWPPQESCYLRGVRGLAPALSEASYLSCLPRCTGEGVFGAAEAHGVGVGANVAHWGGLALTRRTGGGGG